MKLSVVLAEMVIGAVYTGLAIVTAEPSVV